MEALILFSFLALVGIAGIIFVSTPKGKKWLNSL
jgi:hypothetical protein